MLYNPIWKADDASARGRTREAGGDALSRAVTRVEVFVFALSLWRQSSLSPVRLDGLRLNN